MSVWADELVVLAISTLNSPCHFYHHTYIPIRPVDQSRVVAILAHAHSLQIEHLGGVWRFMIQMITKTVWKYGDVNSKIWGHREFTCIEAVHNLMYQYFLGVNKYTPNAAVGGDMGVKVPWQHQNIEIARQWCRFSNI